MILPPRPLRLQPRYLREYWIAAFIIIPLGLIALAAAAWFSSDLLALRHEQAVYAAGIRAPQAAVNGRHTTLVLPFIHSYTLTVDYTDAAGAAYHHEVEFDSLFGAIEQQSEFIVHYDPQRPDDLATSWGLSIAASRRAMGLAWVSFFGLGGLFTLLVFPWALHRAYDARRAADDGQEVELRIVSTRTVPVPGQPVPAVEYLFVAPGDSETKPRKVRYLPPRTPLFLDPDHRLMLGLHSPRNGTRILLIPDNFYPFAFIPDEQRQIRAHIAARPTPAASMPRPPA